MPTAMGGKTKPQPRISGQGSTVAVLGERDVVARRLETALHRSFRFRYHHNSADFLEHVLDPHPAQPGKGPQGGAAPVLYLFNFFCEWEKKGSGSAVKRAACRRQQSDWFRALHQVNARDPSTPILITADQRAQEPLIRRALRAGADEVIGLEEAAIEELVRIRVKKLIVMVKRYRAKLASQDVPHVEEKNVADPGVATEEPDEELSSAERDRALVQLHSAVEQLPTPAARRGPYVDLLEISVPELRGDTGRLDAKRVAERFGISIRKLSRALPVSHQALSTNPDSPNAQEALDPFARTAGILDELLPGERGRQWLNAPHPRLKGRTPLQAMLGGDAERVARVLEIAREGGVGG